MTSCSIVAGVGIPREMDIILQTLDAVIPGRDGTYLAAPISTGRRYFEALHRTGCGDFDSLVATIGIAEYLETVRWPNVRDGEFAAGELRERGVRHLINTGPIFIESWAGADYMSLCFRLLEQKVREVYFHPDWAYSAGAVKDYFFCGNRWIRRSDLNGDPLTPRRAGEDLAQVRSHLQNMGLATVKVDYHIQCLSAEITPA